MLAPGAAVLRGAGDNNDGILLFYRNSWVEAARLRGHGMALAK